MTDTAPTFDAYDAYERFMGRWSRAVGPVFLDWVAPAANARWLEVGCGTGIFTELVLDRCQPRVLHAVDPAEATIEHLTAQSIARRAVLQLGDALALPFENGTFDIVVSALVLTFIPDIPRALSEMRRVAVPSAIIAGYVWDFSRELSPSGPLRRAMRNIGIQVPDLAGSSDSTESRLSALFREAGFERVATRSIEVSQVYADFDDFWQAQTTKYSPTTNAISALSDDDRAELKEAVLRELPSRDGQSVVYAARANAVVGRVPGDEASLA